ncbi:penicillin-binding protein 1B [bacterium endosymbiont of Pedicinus badii]|uniref:penicillin-binding protein 1B n=1 Tax=bacterium endosymbiont of Pedicinus badii TaxID=1719126 RepID=UPI0009BAA9DF|nr:penicillin-binding protein 1B [bacterium endosymbiont of Pedicinus badii]OQM34241.1 hypothetical protein AOQ89_02815 [bacterium endosymbiont of Pedicinus badii]
MRKISKKIIFFWKKNKFFLKKKCIFFILSLIFIVCLYGIYLNKIVKKKISGKIWKFPTFLYSKIVSISPKEKYTISNIVDLLNKLKYEKVIKIESSGQYLVKENSIEVFRRKFDFFNKIEEKKYVEIFFENNSILKIYDKNTEKEISLFFFDPKIIAILNEKNQEQRIFIPIQEFPKKFIEMLISIEDKNFYNHFGIDLKSIFRAIFANLSAKKIVQGGSTLTQQIVKNLFLTKKRTLWRKIKEIYMAIILDIGFSKKKVLEIYLNEVYLGKNRESQIHGFPMASLYYFGKPIKEIGLEKQIMLIGMTKGASLYNPYKNPEITLKRRNLLLQILKKNGFINEKEYKIFINRSLDVVKEENFSSYPSFLDIVYEEIEKNSISRNNLSGAKIFTTLDLNSQFAAEKSVVLGIKKLQKKNQIDNLESAIVVVDKFNGSIKAIVGSSNPKYFGFNRALQARRSVGSLLKPSIYLTALSIPDKYQLNTWILDKPICLRQSNGKIWNPQNYDKQFRGKVMLLDALVESLNVPTINLGFSLGIDQVVQTLKKLGLSENILRSLPSIFLGSLDLTPIEVAQKFQVISNYGRISKLFSIDAIVSEDKEILYHYFPKSVESILPQAAYLTMYAMQEVASRGTSKSLSNLFSSYNIASKTGTTNKYRDSWFVGIDGKEVIVVWIGKDDNSSSYLTGSSGALFLYKNYLNIQKPKILHLTPPNDIKELFIDNFGNFVCNESSSIRKIPIWIKKNTDFYDKYVNCIR